MTALSSSASRLTAIIVSVALLAVGALPAKAAATELVVEGTVVFPVGYDATTARQPSMILIPVGSTTRRYGDIGPDGRFSVRASDPTISYHLALDDYSAELYEGWVTADGTLSPDRADALVFSSSASITVHATATSTISGRVVLPPGVTYDQTQLTVYATVYQGSGWGSAGGAGGADLRPDLTFTVFGLDEGEVYRLELQDNENTVVGGFVGQGGNIVDEDDALEIPSPATGVVIRPAASLPIGGRATLPDGFDYASTPTHERTWVSLWERDPNNADRWNEQHITAMVEDDGSFHMVGARSDRDYSLKVYSNHHQYEDGWLGPDGELVSEPWRRQTVRGGDTDLALTLRKHTQISGKVELPAGFHHDPAAPPTVTPVVLGYDPYNASYEWWDHSSAVPVNADGTFTTARTHSQTDFKLRLTWLDGKEVHWTSDHTVPTADETKASTTKPRGNVVFPARNSMIALTDPSLSGAATLGSTLRADGGTWNAPSPTLAYQWLRSGKPVTGATAATYKVAKGDIGSRLSVKVTASAPQFPTVSLTSSETAVVPKVRPSVTTTIVKKGTSRSRVKLKVRVRLPGVTTKPTGKVKVWFGKSSRTVKLTAKRKGTVTLTLPRAKATGKVTTRFTPAKSTARYATSTTIATKVTKLTPTVKLTAPQRVTKGTRVKVTVRVTAKYLTAKPTGKVRVTYGTKSRTVQLRAKHKGKLTVTLPRLAKGTHKIRARYVPAKTWKKYLDAKSSTRTTLRVR